MLYESMTKELTVISDDSAFPKFMTGHQKGQIKLRKIKFETYITSAICSNHSITNWKLADHLYTSNFF